MNACAVGEELIALRRELAWSGTSLHEFHARNDKPRVRERVYDVITRSGIRVDATILDKTKTQPHLQRDPLRFYKQAWFMHFKYVAPDVAQPLDEVLVVLASLNITRKKQAVHWAIKDVVAQVSPTAIFHTAFWPAASDPCLQVADYATWAIQRKYETSDTAPYGKIQHLVATEFEPFKIGRTTYY